jgi:hypothetical protein
MDYNQITSFLDKFKKLLSQGEGANRIIIETMTKHISFPIDVSMIKTKGTSIYVTGSPMLRSEILIHKQGILHDLSELLPDRRFTDIR